MSDRFDLRRVETAEALELAIQIRREVFVQEQRIPPEVDQDGRDQESFHVLVFAGDTAVATGRARVRHDEATVSRIAVLAGYRGQGLGRRVVGAVEEWASEEGARKFVLYPHAHLEEFYAKLGYAKTADAAPVGEHRLIEMRKEIRPVVGTGRPV